MKRILGDLRIFQAIHNDLKLSHELVTDQTGQKRYAYVYHGTDPYELEDASFPTITQAFKQARNNEIEALVTHIQDKFEEVEVLLNEYQYVRTRAIDKEGER